jgi:hypothetical protein
MSSDNNALYTCPACSLNVSSVQLLLLLLHTSTLFQDSNKQLKLALNTSKGLVNEPRLKCAQ